jgi:uncharacterized protein
VSLAIVLGCFAVLLVVSIVAFLLATLAVGASFSELTTESELAEVMAQPVFFLLNNLVLAALIPITMVAVWAGQGWRPRWLASVVGGIRWRWMLGCAAISGVVMVVSSVLLFAVDGWPQGEPEKHAVALLVIILFTTPLQAAGEEYFFRGWMTQSIGSLFSRPLLAAAVPALVTATLFAGAHGSQNVWLFGDRFAFGILASYLVWRTGGLEAGIAAHAVNNIVVFIPVILTGGLGESLLVTEAPIEMVGADVLFLVVIGALLTWWARRRSVERLFVPPRLPLWPAPAGSGSIVPR